MQYSQHASFYANYAKPLAYAKPQALPLILAACALWLAAPSQAFDLLGSKSTPLANSTGTALVQDEFLPVDDAFRFSYQLHNGQLELRWDIADHYYLYQERFAFNLSGQAKPTPFYSPAELKLDELFGRETLVHYGLAKVRINLHTTNTPQEISLSYQGCADAGLCYPPQTRTLLVDTSTNKVEIEATEAPKAKK